MQFFVVDFMARWPWKKAQVTLKSMLPFSLNHLNGVAEKEKSRENKVGKREVE